MIHRLITTGSTAPVRCVGIAGLSISQQKNTTASQDANYGQGSWTRKVDEMFGLEEDRYHLWQAEVKKNKVLTEKIEKLEALWLSANLCEIDINDFLNGLSDILGIPPCAESPSGTSCHDAARNSLPDKDLDNE